MGDAESSVNSAGVQAWNAITRCSRWQQWRVQSVPNVHYLPNNAAGRGGPGMMGNPPPPVDIRNTGYDAPYIFWAMWSVKDKAQEIKKKMKNPAAGGRWENPGEDDNTKGFTTRFLAVVSMLKCPWAKYFKPNCPQRHSQQGVNGCMWQMLESALSSHLWTGPGFIDQLKPPGWITYILHCEFSTVKSFSWNFTSRLL